MKRRLWFSSLLWCTAALAAPPLPAERVLVLRADDYIGGSTVTSGTGRALWSDLTAVLLKRGIPARPGEAASPARGLDEAQANNCTLLALPEITEYKVSKQERSVSVRVVWLGLDRSERARCEHRHRQALQKGKQPDRDSLLLDALERCVSSVYGEPVAKPPAASPWQVVRYDIVYGTRPDDATDIPPRLGDPSASPRDLATSLAAGRSVVVWRAHEIGSQLIQRLEYYPDGIAVEAAAEIANIEISNRLRTRLEDRAIEALLDALRIRGRSVPDPMQLAIPALDPLDKIISLVPIVLPAFDPERGLEVRTTTPTTVWARLNVSADGTVLEAVALDGQPSSALEQAKHTRCLPGTRGGQPQAMSVLAELKVRPTDQEN